MNRYHGSMGQSLTAWHRLTHGPVEAGHPLGLALLPLLAPYFSGLGREHLVIAACDDRLRLVSFEEYRGEALTIDAALPALRRALAPERVSQLLLAHNHPCGSTVPSRADCEVTRRIAALSRLAGLVLADHLLFAGGRPVSFRALGLL